MSSDTVDRELVATLKRLRQWAGDDPVKIKAYSHVSRMAAEAENGSGFEASGKSLGGHFTSGWSYLSALGNPFRIAANTALGGIHNIGQAVTGGDNYLAPSSAREFLTPGESPFAVDDGGSAGYTEAVRRNFGGGTGLFGLAGDNKQASWWNQVYSGQGNQDWRWNLGPFGTSDWRSGGYSEALRGADEFAEQTLADPIGWIGFGSGLKAMSTGRRLASTARTLLDRGEDAASVARFIERQAGPRAGLVKQLLGFEQPHDYFTRGSIFNRKFDVPILRHLTSDPALDVFGKGRAGIFAGEAERIAKTRFENAMNAAIDPDAGVSPEVFGGADIGRPFMESMESASSPTREGAALRALLDRQAPGRITRTAFPLAEEGVARPTTLDDLLNSARRTLPVGQATEAEGAGEFSTVRDFMSGKKKNAYIDVPGFKSLYVRKGPRIFGGESMEDVVQIANVEADAPGSGAFTKLVNWIRKEYPSRPISVDEVMTERFGAKLESMGFERVPSNGDGDPTYILRPGSTSGVPEAVAPVAEAVKPIAKPNAVNDFFSNNYDQLHREAKAMLAKRGVRAGLDDMASDTVTKAWETVSQKGFREGEDPWNYVRSTMRGRGLHGIRDAAKRSAREGKSFDVMQEFVGEESKVEEALAAGNYDDAYYSLTTRTGGDIEGAKEFLRKRHGLDVQETTDGFELGLGGGKKAKVRIVDWLPSKTPGEDVAGRARVNIEGVGEVELTKLANAGTVDHELVHVAKALDRFAVGEWNALVNRYAQGIADLDDIEEAVAKGLEANAGEHAGLIRRIKEFFSTLYEAVTGKITLAGTEKRWREGTIFSRTPAEKALMDLNQSKIKNGWLKLLGRLDATTNIMDKTPIRKAIADRLRDPEKKWFVFDIDRFKAVNEVYKHKGGDDVLGQIGDLVNAHFPDRMNGRFGGEEFVVAVEPGDERRIVEFFNSVPKSVRTPGGEPITISGGIANGGKAKSYREIKMNADDLNDLAKKSGRNKLAFDIGGETKYVEGTDVGGRRYVEQYLEKAVEENIADLLAEKSRNTGVDVDRQSLLAEILEGRKDKGSVAGGQRDLPQRGLVLSRDTGWKYSTVPSENKSALDRAVESKRIPSVFDEQPGRSTAKQLFRKGSWSELYARAAEKGWDEAYRIRKAFERSVGGKLAHMGRVTAQVLLKNVPGMLSRTKSILHNGITVNGKRLFEGNLVKRMHEPLREFLTKRHGKVPVEASHRAMDELNYYMVSRRAVSLHDQAVRATDDLVAAIQKEAPPLYDVPGAPDDTFFTEPVKAWMKKQENNPLLFRGLVDAEDIKKASLLSPDEARNYLRGKADAWAKDNIGFDPEGGVSDLKQAREIIADVEADAEKLKAYDGARGVLSEFNAAKVRYWAEKGMITRETEAALLEMKDDYASLLRVMDDKIGGARGAGGDLVQIFKGSQRQLQNPILSAIDSTINSMRRADLNEVWQRFVQQSEPEFLEELGIRAVKDASEGNVKKVFIDGKETFWRFDDEDLFRSVESVGRAEPDDEFSKVLKLYRNVVREAVTHSPGFPPRNYIRDAVMLALTSKHNAKIWGGLKKPTVEEVMALIDAGGDQAGFYGKASESYVREIQSAISELANDKKNILLRPKDFSNMLHGAWDKYGDFLSSVEMRNRLAEFRAARKTYAKQFPDLPSWEIDKMAAADARDLMDFAIMGAWGRKINNFVPFFNPAIQGPAKLFRTAKANPGQFAKRLSMYVIAPSVGCYLFNRSVGAEKEYRELPTYRRDMFWNFKVGDRWLTIPKPFEAGVLGTIPERLIDLAVSGDPKAWNWKDSGLSIFEGISPVDEGTLAGPFRPVIEILTNKDLFRKSYIIPPYEEGLDPRLRKGAENASYAGKALSAITGWTGAMEDPRQWDHMLKSLFAEYGRVATDMTSPNAGRRLSHNLSGGFVRRSAPWSFQSVQEALVEAKRKGVDRRKEALNFRKLLRQTNDQPTQRSMDDLIRAAKQETERIGRISIQDLLEKERKKR